MKHLSRRNLFKLGLGSAAGLLGAGGVASAADATPAQTSGPFHPMPLRRGPKGVPAPADQRLLSHVDRDSDLTFVTDAPGTAIGQQSLVTGLVRDEQDRPLANARVEIWQACVSGRYNHRSDPSTEWLDPEFQDRGNATTDSAGRYAFRTVVPGAYRASPGWIRPPHIHYKVARSGYRELTTQMYFSGVNFYYANRFYAAEVLDRLNERDQVLRAVPRAEQSSVIAVARDPRAAEGLEADMKVFEFDITLAALPATPSSPISDDLSTL